MTSQTDEAAIHLKQNSPLPNQLYVLAGMMVLLCGVLGLAIPLKGVVIELFFPTIALVLLALAKLAERLGKNDFAVLYPDRFEEPGFGDTKRIVHWNQVTSLRWIGSSEDSPRVMISTREFDTPLGWFVTGLSDLRVEDRLVFIRYVRQSASDIPQERWPRFCRQVAVPLLKKAEEIKEREIQEVPRPRTFQEAITIRSMEFLASHPFLSGVLMPVFFLLTLPAFFSRKTCWTIAALLAITSIINIRIVWGDWIEPFTTAVLGTAAAFIVLGFFSISRSPENKNSRHSLDSVKVFGYLVLILVGLPLALSALEKGWLPGIWATPLKWLALALLFSPVLLIFWGHKRNERSVEDLEREALDYWNDREGLNDHK
ncbi:MAG: hypothetical protein KDA63_20690 [Planctomycetales bacterium]|nr:hypothetical protein [Planctomycetales bacterium]